jgi:hypothetical protein
VNKKAIDSWRNRDLNGDGVDDLSVSCAILNGRNSADLINLKEKGF